MRRTILCIVLAAAIPGGVLAQVPAGPEFLVSSTGNGNYRFQPDLAADQNGSFVVVWTDKNTTTGIGAITGRRYDAAGVPVAAPFVVSVPQAATEYPSIASDRAGSFAVVWSEDDGTFGGVKARRYDATGTPLGPGFTVPTQVAGRQAEADVASNAARELFVVWTTEYLDGSLQSVAGRRFDASGNPLGPEFQVNTFTQSVQERPAVAALAGSQFVVVWQSANQDGSSMGVFGQRFGPTGPVGAEFQVNTYTTGFQMHPAVASDATGNFVVAWLGEQDSGVEIFGQRFSAAGARRGGEFRVNTYTTGDQAGAAVSVEPAGAFVVTWWDGSGHDGDDFGVFGQRYDASGARVGVEFLVNSYTTARQMYPSVGSADNGQFVVAWSGSGVFPIVNVFGQRFGPAPPPPPTIDPGGNGVLEPDESVGLVTSWRNLSGAPQTVTGAASNFTGPGAPNNPTYTIDHATADYGTVQNGATASCASTGNCYALRIGPVTAAPAARPALHWDATFREDILPGPLGPPQIRVLHVGDSFADVPRSSPFYRFVETVLHHNLTGGCGGGNFCPATSMPREQMAVFVLVAKEGAGYQPPACVAGSEMFNDVPASSPFCRWIEELAHRNIAGGCGGGNFCPLASVSREQMGVFALATREPAGYSPVPCVAGAERFADVPASSPFCKWIEELARRNIAGGCGGGNFCPVAQVTREQNAVFVSGAFSLALY